MIHLENLSPNLPGKAGSLVGLSTWQKSSYLIRQGIFVEYWGKRQAERARAGGLKHGVV